MALLVEPRAAAWPVLAARAEVRAPSPLAGFQVQLADQRVLRELRAARHRWEQYTQPDSRDESWRRFEEYAYQWY